MFIFCERYLNACDIAMSSMFIFSIYFLCWSDKQTYQNLHKLLRQLLHSFVCTHFTQIYVPRYPYPWTFSIHQEYLLVLFAWTVNPQIISLEFLLFLFSFQTKIVPLKKRKTIFFFISDKCCSPKIGKKQYSFCNSSLLKGSPTSNISTGNKDKLWWGIFSKLSMMN